jgi:hypothetical protein
LGELEFKGKFEFFKNVKCKKEVVVVLDGVLAHLEQGQQDREMQEVVEHQDQITAQVVEEEQEV